MITIIEKVNQYIYIYIYMNVCMYVCVCVCVFPFNCVLNRWKWNDSTPKVYNSAESFQHIVSTKVTIAWLFDSH